MSLEPVLSVLDSAVPPKKSAAAKKVSLDPLHPELALLWKWGRASEVLGHQTLSTVAEERDEWFWSQVWLSPAEALSAQKALRKVPGFSETLVPFATDEAGNYTCHDVKSGALVDWDHETRKQRKLKDSFAKIFTLVAKLLKQEAKVADAPVAPAPVTGALPSAIRAVKSAALRKHAASHKLHGFNGAALSGDGMLVAGQVYGTRNACFAELGKDQPLIPSEPGFAAEKKQMGFVSMSTGGFASEGERLAWRIGEQLSIWSWRNGALSLERGAKWAKADPSYRENNPLRLRGGRLAAAVIVDDKLSVALWPIDQLPPVKTLESATSERKPKTLINVIPWTGADLHFDLDQHGMVTTVDSPDYQVAVISRWDGNTGKRLATKRLKDLDPVDVAVSPDGSRVILVSRSELICFDAKLNEVVRTKPMKGSWYSGARFDPSGTFLVSSSLTLNHKGGELATWHGETLKELGKLQVKEATQGFQVRDVAGGRLVTTTPLACFELR